MKPRRSATASVQRRLEMLRVDRVVIIVVDLVLARPRDLDRRADGAGEERGLNHVVWLGLPSEAAAEERHVDRHAVGRDPERLGDLVPSALGILRAAPRLAPSVGHAGRRGGWFHRRVRQVRDVVVGLHDPRRSHQRGHGVSVVAYDLAGSPRGRFELAPVRHGIIRAIRAVVPFDVQLVPALDGGPRVACDHRYASQRLKAGGWGSAVELHDALDAGDRARRGLVE